MAEIPLFPIFSDLALEHRAFVNGVLSGIERPISEMTFANLYLFRKAHSYKVSRWKDFIFILARGYGGAPYLFPPWGRGDFDEAAAALLSYARETSQGESFFPVPSKTVEEHFRSQEWTARTDRDQADYVYRRVDLANLPGARYHKRKNRLEKFLRETALPVTHEKLEERHIEECVRIAREWCEERCPAKRPSAAQETEAAVEALELRAELGLTGAVITVDGRVRAYCLGEPLDETTFLVQFEKADSAYPGLAQVINRDFCLYDLNGYEFVNREQDLGDIGLRQAKESYYPAFLAEKFVVSPAL